MLLDSASMYFRAFYGVPETMTAPDGTPVNAVRGLLDMMSRLVRARQPDRLVACLDAAWRPAFRTAAIPSYKAHRANPDGSEQVPDALTAQLPVILEVLAAAGVATAEAAGYEADDVIGTLAAREPGPVEVVTGDRDLFQVVDDERGVRVLYIARGLAKLEVVDEAAVTRRYEIPGRAYAAFAALRGDPSDGLPGVSGVGEKTAAALVRKFGSIPGPAGRPGRRARRLPDGQPGQADRRPGLPGRLRPGGGGGHHRAAPARRRRAAVPAGRPGPAGRAGRALGPGLVAGPAALRARRPARMTADHLP